MRDGNEIQASSLSALESPIARYCLSRFSRTTRPCRDFIVESRVSLALRSYLDRTSAHRTGAKPGGTALALALAPALAPALATAAGLPPPATRLSSHSMQLVKVVAQPGGHRRRLLSPRRR